MKVDKDTAIQMIIDLRYKQGYSSPELVRYLMDTYKINISRSYELINEAKEKLGEMYSLINNKSLEEAIIILENMRQDAIKSKNGKLALEVQKELNKVNQLHIKKLDITSGGEKIIININKQDE
jgi:hypothetical protein